MADNVELEIEPKGIGSSFEVKDLFLDMTTYERSAMIELLKDKGLEVKRDVNCGDDQNTGYISYRGYIKTGIEYDYITDYVLNLCQTVKNGINDYKQSLEGTALKFKLDTVIDYRREKATEGG